MTLKDIEKFLQVIDNAIITCEEKSLSDIEVDVLIGSLNGEKYEDIADRSNYTHGYISKYVAFRLWRKLSKALGETVRKKNIKIVVRRTVNGYQHNSINN